MPTEPHAPPYILQRMVSLLKVNHQQHFAVFSSGIRPNNRTFHRKSSFISMSSKSPTTIQHLHNTVSSSSNHNLDIPIMVLFTFTMLSIFNIQIVLLYYFLSLLAIISFNLQPLLLGMSINCLALDSTAIGSGGWG